MVGRIINQDMIAWNHPVPLREATKVPFQNTAPLGTSENTTDFPLSTCHLSIQTENISFARKPDNVTPPPNHGSDTTRYNTSKAGTGTYS